MPGCSISSALPTEQATEFTAHVAYSAIFGQPARVVASIVSNASCGRTGSSLCAATKGHAPFAGHPSIIAPNRLQREFTVDAANKVWVTDITYVRTWQGWLYLAVVVDLYARKVVGWSMKPSLSKELALDALLMAVWRRKLAGRVVVHSDQGSQYGSDDFKRFCQSNNLEPSMSGCANCWDNDGAESFSSSFEEGTHPKTHLQNTRPRPPTSSTISTRSITEPAATVIWAAPVRRRSETPGREAGSCLQIRVQSSLRKSFLRLIGQ